MNPNPKNNIRFVFFGTAPLAENVLAQLKEAGLVPERVIENAEITDEFIDELSKETWDVFVVASFGKILPKKLLDIPKHGVVNVHPSLLPRLRGPSPIRSAILNDEKETGVSIMLLDEKMDHGPILAQKKIAFEEWPPHGKDADELLSREGGRLLAQVLPLWVAGEIEARAQNHDVATYCSAFKKEDGLINLNDDACLPAGMAYKNLLKIRALEGWPGTYTFFERPSTRSGQGLKKLRVQIIDAHLDGNPSTSLGARKLVIDTVKPEGKNEMSYDAFLRSGAKPA